MGTEPFSASAYTMGPNNSQQESRYSMNATAGQKPHTSMPPPPSPGYQPAPYIHADQAPQVGPYGQAPAPAPSVITTHTPADPLEQRVLDLLYPYRDECFKDDDDTTVARERAALILCGALQLLNFVATI